MAKVNREFGTYNEWGTLREVFIGIEHDYVEPEWMTAFAWMGKDGQEYCRKYGGRKSIEVVPDQIKVLREQIENHVKAVQKCGVKVHRNIPFKYPEEAHFLDNVQKGAVFSGGADFFRFIGKNCILLNNLRYPFRRKQVYTVRPVLEPLLKGADVRYVALPPASPHYTENDIYLENGDIMLDGHNIYVGHSGLGTSDAGMDWLQQFMGHEYRIFKVPLAGSVLHLDTVLMLNRPGLLTYYPELVKEMPKPLEGWHKIKVRIEPGDGPSFGANSLSINEKTIIMATEYERLVPEYKKRGIETIVQPYSMSMAYGSGPRCLTGVLRRDR